MLGGQSCAGATAFMSCDAVSSPSYALTHWAALTRYPSDGRLEIDNNAAERSLRGVAAALQSLAYVFHGF